LHRHSSQDARLSARSCSACVCDHGCKTQGPAVAIRTPDPDRRPRAGLCGHRTVSGASDRAPSEAGAARPVGGKRPRRNGSRPYAPPAVELVRSIQGGTRAAGDPPPEACGLRGHGRPASLAVRHCGRARGLPSHARPPARSSAAASKLLMRVCPARWRATTRDDHIHPERCLWARASAIQSDRNAVVHRFGHRDRSG
jgi:hypothetical protein